MCPSKRLRLRWILPYIIVLAAAVGCTTGDWRKQSEDPAFLHATLKAITDRIVFDIFSPPVASRIYAYTTIATYETVRHADSTLVTLSGQLNGLGPLPQPEPGKEYQFNIAAVQAMYRTGKALVFSEEDLDKFYDSLSGEIRKTGIPRDVLERSLAFGDSVSAAVLRWSSTDHYKQTRSFPKYTIQRDESTWKPTPPAYMDAVEPHWNMIRPFVLDSASQFRPSPPIPFSTTRNSDFYNLALEVRDIVANLTPEQKEIASFWDCNPFMMNVNGHVMFANKKISPGGHWINITAQVCRSLELSPARSSEAYVRVSVALADAFISCWDEKY
ncbi:MAG: phosphatidic acid phosphatase, partial [Bacteroidota bacterium]